MSSKSRKKSQKKSPAHPGEAAVGQAAVEHEHHTIAEVADELVRVPKDKSRLQFWLMIFLLVFLLIVFVIPGALSGISDDTEFEAVLRWNDPVEGTIEMDSRELATFKRSLSSSLQLESPYFLVLRLGMQDPSRPGNDEDAVRLLVLDRLAQQAGVHVSDHDLMLHLRQLIDQQYQGDVNGFKALSRQYGGTILVEDGIRRALRVTRYIEMMGRFAQAADPADIERLWHDQHEELAFDFVDVAVADLRADAEAEVPDDAAVEAWFDELEEADRLAFRVPEKRAAQVVSWSNGADASALLAAYPTEEEKTAEELAQGYYDRVFFRRFERPAEPEPEEEAATDEEGADEEQEAAAEDASEESTEKEDEAPKGPYLSMDEVRDQATAEAPIYFAMERWLQDLQARVEAGEEIDMTAEAERLGLETTSYEARTKEAYEDDGFRSSLSILVFQTKPESIAQRLEIDADGFRLLRVDEVIESSVPEFADIRDDVVESWIEERAQELALERLAAVRDGFAVLEVEDEDEDDDADDAADEVVRRSADEDAFRAAVEAAGHELRRRPWLDRAGKAIEDPDQDDPAHVFFRSGAWGDLEEGEVPEPELGAAGEHAYLFRLVGRREVPVARMTAVDFESLKGRARYEADSQLKEQFTFEALCERYDVWLLSAEPREQEEGELPVEG